MVDPIDEARATLTDELNILAGLYHVGRGQLEAVRAAADRHALAVFDEGYAVHRLAVEGNWTDCNKRFDALRARLEGGQPC